MTAQSVYIHHNTFNGCGYTCNANYGGGVALSPWGNGVAIEYNVFDGCYQAGILFMGVISSAGSACTAIVRNNNIINTKGSGHSSGGLSSTYVGYGIYNAVPTRMVATINSNYFNNNLKGSVYPTSLLHTGDLASAVVGAGGGGSSTIPSDPTTDPNIDHSIVTINGYVYDSQIANGIEGAVVTIMNNTWSATAVTNFDGYYEFHANANTGVYWISASATDYLTTPYQMPLSLLSSSYGLNIALVHAPTYFTPHYTTFIVQSPFGTKYSGVNVTVYDDHNYVVGEGFTDANGAVIFKLDPSIAYTITFVDDEQNIDTTRIVSPSEASYNVWVWFATKRPDTGENGSATITLSLSDIADYRITQSKVNLTHSYLNQTLTLKDGVTTPISSFATHVYEVDKNGSVVSGGFDYSNVYYNTPVDWPVSVILVVPNNRSYVVHTEVEHPSLSAKDVKHNIVTIDSSGISSNFDLGFQDQTNYSILAYVLMLMAGGIVGVRSVKSGAVMMLFIGYGCMFIGWIPTTIVTEIMAGFATVLVLAAVLRSDA
jgi:hypothetical protein